METDIDDLITPMNIEELHEDDIVQQQNIINNEAKKLQARKKMRLCDRCLRLIIGPKMLLHQKETLLKIYVNY